jgi:hypothetical protein
VAHFTNVVAFRKSDSGARDTFSIDQQAAHLTVLGALLTANYMASYYLA